MTIAMQPIFTQTIGAGGAFSFALQNIPQFYTDLVLKISARNVSAVNNIDIYIAAINNESGSNTNLSTTYIYGTGSAAVSARGTSQTVSILGQIPGTSSTAGTFGSCDVYIPNYTSSNFKSWTADAVTENNGTAAQQTISAGLWRQTAAINAFTLYCVGGAYFAQHSTFTLYGITKG
jgi:hypothetical protein